MYPVQRSSNEYKRRQTAFVDEVVERLAVREASSLFGAVPTELVRLLEAGLEELPPTQREAFVSTVERAQAVLRDQCMKAVFASGRAQYLAPDNVADVVDYKTHRIKLRRPE
jgi:predicted urease superfamily metal-dependent hydrolase